MKAIVTDREALQSISISDLAAYLRAAGWVGQPPRERPFTTWTITKDGQTFDLDMPARSDFLDYARRTSEVLANLMAVEERSQMEIFQDIQRAQVDVLRVRLEGPNLDNGRISLEGGSKVTPRVRDGLLAAACAEIEKRSAFAARKPEAAMDFVRNARIAASERGSHVVVIEVPLPPQLQLNLTDDAAETPFERRAMLLFADALQYARRAVTAAAVTSDAGPFLENVSKGLSSNLCDALAGIVTDSGASAVTFAHAWATSRPIGPNPPPQTRFVPADCPFLTEGARILREREPQIDFELEGQIIDLHSEAPKEGGVVTVAAMVEGRVKRVKITLSADDYKLACEAHSNGWMFTCEGELHKEKNLLVLRNPRRASRSAT